MDAGFADMIRVASMYLIGLFLLGYASNLISAVAFGTADLFLVITLHTAAVIAASLNAVAVALCIGLLVWFGEFLGVHATFAMLIAPVLYLAYFDYTSVTRSKESRTTRLLLGRYKVPFDERVERGHAAGDVLGLIIGIAFFMPHAPLK